MSNTTALMPVILAARGTGRESGRARPRPDADTIGNVDDAVRPRLTIAADPRAVRSKPAIRVRQHTLRPPGLAPLDALIATPPEPTGVLVYFPGFNTTLGPWEIAKCAHLADATSLTVVVTEIPGMSRFGDAIPRAVRREMLRGRIDAWADLNLAYTREALHVGGVANTEYLQVLGYSTGCSLAVASLPVLGEWGPIEGLNLVEPVAISERNIAALQAHNLADWGRMPLALATNKGHEWVLAARRAQGREPSVRYSPVDLVAIGQVLATQGLLEGLDAVELARCALVRGARSSLCRLRDYERLDALLAERGVPGPTITVDGLGHQLWHSFPVVVQLTRAMLGDVGIAS
jgi:hypothetical protein